MESGYMRFASRFPTPLLPDTYTLTVSQEVSGVNCKIQNAQFTFTCEAEPFNLQSGDVYSVYPPRGSYGKFELVLPHIVFTRRTLPWERLLFKGSECPWLSLLLYDENEGVTLRAMSAGDAFSPAARVYCPVKYTPGTEENCMVLDVPATLFCDTFPTEGDLAYTAHARGVSRDNKVTEPQIMDEWLSVLIATRYPASNTSNTGVKNTAYVVSCEAFAEFLRDGDLRTRVKGGKDYDYVRIPVLTSWDFFSYKEDFDFKSVFLALNAGPLALPSAGLEAEAQNLISMGYAPVDHLLREGSNTVSWYHGPFVPYNRQPQTRKPQYFADSRLIYEPEMGMFDISNATAFSLGRQLALKSQSFAAALDEWRRGNKREAAANLQKLTVSRGTFAEDGLAPDERILSIIESAALELLEKGEADE